MIIPRDDGVIVERDLTRVEQALHDGSIAFAADAVRTVVDEMRRLARQRVVAANEVERLDARVEFLVKRAERAVNCLWAIKELANGLGETLIEAEAERLLKGLEE